MTNKKTTPFLNGTTHMVKPEFFKSPMWTCIKVDGEKCFNRIGDSWVQDDSILQFLDYYNDITKTAWSTETPEETEAFNKMKPYEFDEHVSVAKVPSEKMKVALKEADGDGFLSRCMVIPVSIDPFRDGYSVGYKLPPEEGAEEAKPVFTQAMAAKKELPPVGSMYLNEDSQACQCLGYSIECNFIVGQMTEHPSSNGYPNISTSEKTCVKPIDTRTPKQKAVDEIQDVVCSQGFLSKHDVSLGIAEALYNAGYRKC